MRSEALTFDYETAWKELAAPMFHALPANVRDLYARVIQEAGHLSQGKNLNMPWPEWPPADSMGVTFREELSLKQAFAEVPAEILAVASRVIHNYGHWWPGAVAGGPNPDRVGGGWKFSNYADQSLAARIHESLDPRWPDRGNGFHFRIFEGFIRCQVSTPDSWTWQEVGLGTLTTWERLRKLQAEHAPSLGMGRGMTRAMWAEFVDKAEEFMKLLQKELRPAGRVAEFLDHGYMIPESEFRAREDARRAARQEAERKAKEQAKHADIIAFFDLEISHASEKNFSLIKHLAEVPYMRVTTAAYLMRAFNVSENFAYSIIDELTGRDITPQGGAQ